MSGQMASVLICSINLQRCVVFLSPRDYFASNCHAPSRLKVFIYLISPLIGHCCMAAWPMRTVTPDVNNIGKYIALGFTSLFSTVVLYLHVRYVMFVLIPPESPKQRYK
jgi:hypothetical protein